MFSRYDLMTGSPTQTDPADNQVWPDPLSVDFTSFTLTQAPFILQPDDRLEEYPYLVMYSIYVSAQYDDIILSLNNVPHISKVQNFPSIQCPVFSDLAQFFGQGTT